MYVGKNPLPVTLELLELGQTKFNTYCSPCHDQTGMGNGIVASRPHLAALQFERRSRRAVRRRRDLQRHHQRPPHHAGLSISVVMHDRWAIVAYVRALQRAAQRTLAEVPAGTTCRSEIKP